MAIDLTNLKNKTENNGEDERGILRAEDFNNLVKAVIENQDGIYDVQRKSVKGIRLNTVLYNNVDSNGIIDLTISDSNYLLDIKILEAPPKYVAKGAPCRFRFTITHKNIKASTADNYVFANIGAVAKFHWGATVEEAKANVVGQVNNIFDIKAAGTDALGVYGVTEVIFDYNGKANLTTGAAGNVFYIELTNSLGNKGDQIESEYYTTYVFNMSVNANIRHLTDKSGVSLPVFTQDDMYGILVNVSGSRAKLSLQIDNHLLVDGAIFGAGAQDEYLGTDTLFNVVNTHGIHEISVWATPINENDEPLDASIRVNGNTIRYIYGISSEPIIMSSINSSKDYEKYSKLPVEYIAYYKDRSSDTLVNLSITNSTDGTVYFSADQNIEFVNSVGSGSYTFSLTPNTNANIIGQNTLNITIGDGENIYTDTTYINIIDTTAQLSHLDKYKVYLTSAGRSNSESIESRKIWASDTNGVKTTFVTFDDTIEFNEAGSGWNQDENLNTTMHLKKNKYFTLDYKPFAKNPFGTMKNPGTGLTISVEFATRNCLSQDAEVIKCFDESSGKGFIVYANKVLLASESKTLSCDFAENTRVKLDIVIEGTQKTYDFDTVVGTDGTTYKGSSDEALMIIYLDGVYQRLSLIPAGESFMQSIAQNIKFGSDKCDLDIYNIRIYEQALNIDQIVKNYSYDTPEYSDKVAIAKRNDIFDNPEDNTPKIDIGKLTNPKTGARPDLPIVYITMKDNEPLPNNKSDWKALSYSAYINPRSKDNKDIGNSSWETVYGVFRNQGTSSMNYPWPWRNWDFKLDKYKDGEVKKNGFFEIPKIGGTPTEQWLQYLGMPAGISKITWKKDYASSEMCNNAICSELFTDMALGICKDYPNVLSPTMKTLGESTPYRLTFKAIPCFMFNKIDDGVNETTYEAMGMMNLIPNKNECGYLGFVNGNVWEDGGTYDNNGNEILKPRAQSWEICENHIFWDYELHSYHADNFNVGDTVNDYTVMLNDNGDGHYFGKDDYVYKTDEDGKVVKDEDGNPIFAITAQNFGNFINGVDGNYEARYPKDSTSGFEDFGYFGKGNTVSKEIFEKVYNEHKDILEFHNWVVSCNQGLATNEPINDDILKAELWNRKSDGSYEYDTDTAEYRRHKFINEGQGYEYTAADGSKIQVNGRLMVDQWVLYYIWREQFWMFDSGSKNLQLYTMDERYNNENRPINDVLTWGCMVRDADTALGIDNIGVDKFPAHLEDIDYYTESGGKISFTYGGAKGIYTTKALNDKHTGAQHVLNGQFGAIWLNIRDCFTDKIEAMYKKLVSESNKTNFSAQNAIKRFNDHQDNWCESLYNFGMRQYFGGTPFSDRITSGNGNKRSQRKSWLEKGFYYRNSKYNNLSDVFNFRGFVYSTDDKERDNILNVTTYIPMYVGVGSSDKQMNGGKTYRITNPNAGVLIDVDDYGLDMDSGDKNVFFFGSDYITDLGDYARYFVINDITMPVTMPKLTSLKLGDHTGRYTRIITNEDLTKSSVQFYNDKLINLDCTPLSALSYLDVTNYKQLGTGNKGLIISENKQLEEFYGAGTDNITELNFPETSTLRIIRIGSGLRSLKLKNLTGLTEFSWGSLSNVGSVEIVNCSELISKDKSLEIINECLEKLESNFATGTESSVCTLHGIDWTEKAIDENILVRLSKICKNGDIKGKIKLSSLNYKNKMDLISKFGEIDNPNNALYITYDVKPIGGIQMPTITYISRPNSSTQLYFTPNKPNGNNFTRYAWSIGIIQNNVNNVSAEINENTGMLRVTGIGTEATKEYVTVSVKVYNKNYETDEETEIANGTTTVHLYERSAKVGDLVYHDGTYLSADEHDSSKDVIGICFYVEPKNSDGYYGTLTDDVSKQRTTPLRLMITSDLSHEIISNAYPFGLHTNLNPELDFINGSIDNTFNIQRIEDVASSIASFSDWSNYKTAEGGWYYGRKSNNDGKQYAIAQIGPVEKDGIIYSYGEFNTNEIIKHRNEILKALDVKTPQEIYQENVSANPSYTYTEYDDSKECITQASKNATLIDKLLVVDSDNNDNSKYFKLVYYPQASLCYTFEPNVTNKSVLLDKFKKHNWFIGSGGEVFRLAYYINVYNNDKTNAKNNPDNIFFHIFDKKIIPNLDSILTRIVGQNMSTSSEISNNNYLTLTDWNSVTFRSSPSEKYYTYTKQIIPMCKF